MTCCVRREKALVTRKSGLLKALGHRVAVTCSGGELLLSFNHTRREVVICTRIHEDGQHRAYNEVAMNPRTILFNPMILPGSQ